MKVLIITGTQLQEMSRLVTALNSSEIIRDFDIYYQSAVEPKLDIEYKWIGLVPQNELNIYQDNADFLIIHGGTGSLMKALNLGKNVLAVPRLSSYGEHVNDHQQDLTDLLDSKSCVVVWNEGDDFNSKVKEALNFETKPYPFYEDNTALLHEILLDSRDPVYDL